MTVGGNWSRSSKAMEADIAGELVKKANDSPAGVQVGFFIGDDDAAAMKHL